MDQTESAPLPAQPQYARADRFMVWPLLASLGVPLSAGIAMSFGPMGAPLIGLLGLGVWLLAAIFAAVLGLIFAWGAQWRRATSLLLVPCCLAAFVLCLPASIAWPVYAGDFIHFLALRSSYEAQVAAIPGRAGSRFMQFDWGGFMLDPVDLVYDESDELALPQGRQSELWRRQHGEEFTSCAFDASRLPGHFFVVRFYC